MSEPLRFFAPCPKGIESLLDAELRRIGVRGVRPQRSGVLFAGTVADGLKALAWTRLASRVLLTIGEVDATSADAFYEGVRSIAWEDHVRAGGTIAVDATGINAALRNTQFTAVRAKDAVADRFRERFGRRPSVDTAEPDLRVNVVVREAKATVSVDLAGSPLHRRGYREAGKQVVAPMKETLAAAVLELAGWREIAASGGPFRDPLCGSGTLAIEAELAAGDIAPALLWRSCPVERWLGFDADAWARIIERAEQRRARGLASMVSIEGSDTDARAVELARSSVRRAGLEQHVRIERRELSRLEPPTEPAAGLIATNPPWGERLSERTALPSLYAEMRRTFIPAFAGWTLAVVSPDPALSRGLRLEARRAFDVGTGKGAARVSVFALDESSQAAGSGAGGSSAGAAGDRSGDRGSGAHADSGSHADMGAEAFANRLRKMAKHHGKWARRTGVTCYRVYDADLPDYAVAIDVYEGTGADSGRRWAHIAEYAAPSEVDPQRATDRITDVLAVVPSVLEVRPENVFLKRRARQRGTAQYERVSSRSVSGLVAENGLTFEVNLSDYLDTGLFLDHRDTRAWVRELAAGHDFLNLFAYTGTASVYAADGGAATTTTVDLSATYLEWAKRNLERNGFTGARHAFVQADVMRWVREAAGRGERYGLIFCDPPTFSNSKRMDDTWDVQRDHAELIEAIVGLLADEGTLVFSCNRRRFKLDAERLSEAGLAVRDVTARTIPKDFERHPQVHSCWTIRRA